MEERALSIQEVATYLSISHQMVYNLIKNDQISSFKVGNAVRVLSSDLQDYIDRQKAVTQAVNTVYENRDMSAFSVQNICNHKGCFNLSKISFSFPLGKTISIVGPSGSGKTFLLKSIAGLEALEAGAVFSGPERIDKVPVGARRLGFVFQDYSLHPLMDSNANIGFPHLIRKMSKAQIDEEVAHIVSRLQIPAQFLTKNPDSLPQGIKHLVAIGHAQSNALDMYIMDEPMNNLDPAIRAGMRVFLKALVDDLGKTTLFAFNDPADALSLSDYVGVLDQGRLVQFGPVREVYERPVNPVALESLSAYGTVRIPVTVADGRTAPLGLPAAVADGVYVMYLRPDEIDVADGEAGSVAGLPSEGEIAAEVLSSRFIDGSRQISRCRLGGEIPADLLLPPNSAGSVTIRPRRLYFFPV